MTSQEEATEMLLDWQRRGRPLAKPDGHRKVVLAKMVEQMPDTIDAYLNVLNAIRKVMRETAL
jgi:hypothetical protein